MPFYDSICHFKLTSQVIKFFNILHRLELIVNLTTFSLRANGYFTPRIDEDIIRSIYFYDLFEFFFEKIEQFPSECHKIFLLVAPMSTLYTTRLAAAEAAACQKLDL